MQSPIGNRPSPVEKMFLAASMTAWAALKQAALEYEKRDRTTYLSTKRISRNRDAGISRDSSFRETAKPKAKMEMTQ
jgi:hypothetical protein